MRLFGTDGIRAPFGDYPLDRTTVIQLGFRLAEILKKRSDQPSVIIGGDTRDSTPEISCWLATGLEAGGAHARFGGVLPTPAIARAVLLTSADAGIAVSASHNLHPYNGIKLFDAAGFKWSPEAEAELEALIVDSASAIAAELATMTVDPVLGNMYLRHLTERINDPSAFAGLKIVLDAANGAATPFSQRVFEALGAQVIAIGNHPDGTNINAGFGSTAPERMLAAVEESGADLGVAFDGDADRALIADDQGQMRDGDAMLFLWARHLQSLGELDPAAIVATSMSNLGLEVALKTLDIAVTRCDVGDRTVVATMRNTQIRLGGEQSGHLVDLHSTTTGDGLATALQMASILQKAEVPLAALLADFRRFPQVLRNVVVESKPDFATLPEVTRVAGEVERTLGDQGRLVLRYSGTEPLARVMIEGPDLQQIEALAGQLIAAIQDAVGKTSE